ncbi:MAG: PbpA [Desulfobacula sp.]|nr:PbpA [Desulfobacula sp.]
MSKNQLNNIISHTQFTKTDKNIFFVDTPEDSYKITTSIDIYLQEYLLSLLERLKRLTRGKPQRIAFVIMEADTGKIIAMTGFDLENPDANPCTESDYPAASIFKIVTAAAAVETLGYTPQTQLYFNGNKYTLYKRQLKDVKNKYSYKISFSRAFAESVNPVFGKIGKNYLGKEKLESYAGAFGFNRVIHSELPFTSGSFETNGSAYHLAELGCGFNNDTTISPVFGAMLISAVVNSGKVMLPSIVEHVTDSDGHIIYKNKKATYITAIKPETAATMMQLMEKTISKGTARKSFRGALRDKVLSKLIIGGKTGSLYNKEHTVKYDWFTGFGKEKKTNKKIALSIVVGHRKYIGTRATTYAKMILKQYFKKNDTTAQL